MPKRSEVIDAFTGLFSSVVDGRAFRSILPQGIMFPAIRYEVVGQLPHNTFSGPSELDFLTIDVHIYDSNNANCEAIAEQVRGILEAVSTPNETFGSIRFKESGDEYAQGLSKYHIQQEYKVSFSRAVKVDNALTFEGQTIQFDGQTLTFAQ